MTSYIYIVSEKGQRKPTKIGIANDPWRRLRTLQCGNHRKMLLRDAITIDSRDMAEIVEGAIHQKYHVFKVSGEWLDIGWRHAKKLVRDEIETQTTMRMPREGATKPNWDAV